MAMAKKISKKSRKPSSMFNWEDSPRSKSIKLSMGKEYTIQQNFINELMDYVKTDFKTAKGKEISVTEQSMTTSMKNMFEHSSPMESPTAKNDADIARKEIEELEKLNHSDIFGEFSNQTSNELNEPNEIDCSDEIAQAEIASLLSLDANEIFGSFQ